MATADDGRRAAGRGPGPVLGVDRLPVRLRAWDGSDAGPDDAPLVVVRSPQALRRLVWAPGRAGARPRLRRRRDSTSRTTCTRPSPRCSSTGRLAPGEVRRPTALAERLALLRTGLALGVDRPRAGAAAGGGPPPPVRPPAQQAPRRRRDRPPLRRRQRLLRAGARAVDGLLLRRLGGRDGRPGGRPGGQARPGLPQARAAPGHAAARRRLRLGQPGACTPRSAYGADVVGITLSQEQAALARKRVAEAGLTDRIEIRVQDYRGGRRRPVRRDQLGRAWPSTSGRAQAARATPPPSTRCCGPAGGCSTTPSPGTPAATTWNDDTFIARYVFPDGELVSLGDMVNALSPATSRCSTSRRCGSTTR